MTSIASAWGRVPGYKIDVTPHRGVGRAWHGDLLLAESDRCLLVAETDHAPRLYFPESDVRFELFQATDHHTVCPFKGQADYWTLTASDPPLDNVVWAYPEPFAEVGGIAGHVCFYDDRVRVEVVEDWDGARDVTTVNRFPTWGDASDLLGLLDVEPSGASRFVSPPYHEVSRNVVEGGHLLAQAIVATSKSIPGQRVTFASMTFPKAASFDAPLDIDVDVLRQGKTFSTVESRTSQGGRLRSAGLLLTDAGAPDVFRVSVPMPDVPGPDAAEPHDMRVTGRALRIVDGAYDPDPDRVGPPEIYAWIRFRDAPGEPYLHQALLAQATTHWSIAAAMRPHKGFGEADAHATLSTGIMAVTVSFHDDVDVTEWHLYANPAVHAGRGLAQGEGHIFRADGGLVASYTVQAMIRAFTTEPGSMGLDSSNAM
jgi:acyl-CoA thioesterase II